MSANIININNLSDNRLDVFNKLTDAQLRAMTEFKSGLFIAESPKVIKIALANGFEPICMLCERKHIDGDAKEIIDSLEDIDIFTGDREVLKSITGYVLTRGVLCAMKRKPLPTLSEITEGAKRVCVLDGVVDSTNIGSIFRSAAALDIDAVVLSHKCCEPLNRRVVRVSMGTVFLVPWTICDNPVDELRALGFKTLALALRDESFALGEGGLESYDKLAYVFGAEGDGLSREVIDKCDYTVKIPMSHNVDSLNVGAAAAVTFWALRPTTGG